MNSEMLTFSTKRKTKKNLFSNLLYTQSNTPKLRCSKALSLKVLVPMPSFWISFHQGYCCSLKNCSGAHSFCITFSYISSCSVGELQANTGAVITYTLYMGVTHKEGETTPNGVEETFDHKCFETLLLTPAQRLSLLLISLSAAEKQHFSFNMRGNSMGCW